MLPKLVIVWPDCKLGFLANAPTFLLTNKPKNAVGVLW